jgi:hypothetical protein
MFLPPREVERKKRDSIRVAEPAPAPLKFPAVVARDQLTTGARETEASALVTEMATSLTHAVGEGQYSG